MCAVCCLGWRKLAKTRHCPRKAAATRVTEGVDGPMPLNSSLVGASTNALTHEVDARWLMAYAAGLGDDNPVYRDTVQAGPVVAHPMFAACVEWPVQLEARRMDAHGSITPAESARGVHATHDLRLYRPIRAGETVVTQGRIIRVQGVRPGAASTMRLDTRHAATGELIARTHQVGIYRDVAVEGGDRAAEDVPAPPAAPPLEAPLLEEIAVPAGAAHVYTECARIWNPIHTDRAVALEAGLPDIILHGTATMALAVSRIVDRYADGDPARVKRLGGRFAAMVLMPSTLQLETAHADGTVAYQVRNGAGDLAIRGGYVCLA